MGRLDAWGRDLFHAFGDMPYLVGTAATGKGWRDVDVRIIMADEAFDREFGAKRNPDRANLKWAALCTALSIWGREVTGLPIDFQFQRQTQANEHDGGRLRVPIGLDWDQMKPYRDSDPIEPPEPSFEALAQDEISRDHEREGRSMRDRTT
jgi:hypothetical protein